MARPPKAKLAPGIRRTSSGWQIYARVLGKLHTKRFKPDTAPVVLREALKNMKARARFPAVRPASASSLFPEDAAAYLKLVRHMPSFDDREYEVNQWAKAFAGRTRQSLTGPDIRAVLESWRVSGRADGKGGLSASSLNKRRTALMSLFTTLDGKSAANPVRDVPEYDESESEQIRAISLSLFYRLLVRVGRLKWKTRRKVHQGTKRRPSKTRARLRVMLWTGWPHKQLMALKPDDVDWDAGTARVSPRRKGKGYPATTVPLLPQALHALKRFDEAKAWGKFSQSGMHKALSRAVTAENAWRAKHGKRPVKRVRPYDARHQFGHLIATVTNDERAIQSLMLHSTSAQTRRYTGGANQIRMKRAIQGVAAALDKRA